MKIIKFIASVAITFSAGIIGSLATTPNIPTWYAGLDKPFFNPPNWVFGPVWSLLYLLLAISLYLVWTNETEQPKTKAYVLFGLQIVLNTIWSIVFFALHQLWLALAILLAMIAATVILFFTIRNFAKISAYLLLPYLAWISFACCLNLAVAILN